MKDAKYSDASVMHPLPRVEELDIGLDADRRAVYFQQAAYGVPIRMALISLLLNLKKNKSLQKFSDGFVKPDHPIYCQPIGTGIQCVNENCISRDPSEQRYAANKFYLVRARQSNTCRLRCVYCETDIEDDAARNFVVADTSKQTYTDGIDHLLKASAEKLKSLVIQNPEPMPKHADFV